MLVIGDKNHAFVEEFDGKEWTKLRKMSPVKGLQSLFLFSTISVGNNLFIFGKLWSGDFFVYGFFLGGLQDGWPSSAVLKWDDSSWTQLNKRLRDALVSHVTFLYNGKFIHCGGCFVFSGMPAGNGCDNNYRFIEEIICFHFEKLKNSWPQKGFPTLVVKLNL